MSVQSQLAAGECSRWQDYLDDQMKKGEEMKQGIRIEGEQEMTTWGVEIRRLRRMCRLIEMLPCSLV